MEKVALVTGASRGIGRAIAARLSREGWAVCVNYHTHQAQAEELVEELRSAGGRAIAVQADVAQREQVHRMVGLCEARLGPISLLVNNAGIAESGLFQDVDDDTWSRMLAVNLTGPRNACMEVLPQMISEKAGTIVNVSSIWGLRGASCEVAYACTKAAVVGLTRSLALELAPSGIRVNAVAPGCVDTDMMKILGEEARQMVIEQTPLGRLGQVEDIANVVAFLASEQSSFMTGQVLTADGGFIG